MACDSLKCLVDNTHVASMVHFYENILHFAINFRTGSIIHHALLGSLDHLFAKQLFEMKESQRGQMSKFNCIRDHRYACQH